MTAGVAGGLGDSAASMGRERAALRHTVGMNERESQEQASYDAWPPNSGGRWTTWRAGGSAG